MQNSSIDLAFKRALDIILMRVFHGEDTNTLCKKEALSEALSVAVAYSGGLDSTVLLHLAKRFLMQKNISLFAFHVHHGLSNQADAWLDHCERVCATLSIPFESRRVQVDRHARNGMEADARLKRYAALGEMCRKNQVTLLLTAHHQDDQIETVLFHLMRGTGIAGLCGMDAVIRAPELLEDTIPFLGRPLLSLSRDSLSQWARDHHLSYVEDESNFDIKYTRNVIRHDLVPVLSKLFPGFQKRLVRMTEHVRSAHKLLKTFAKEDLRHCRVSGNRLDLAKTESLDALRIDHLLRCWLMENGVRIPSTSWFSQAKKQMLDARPDAQIHVRVDDYVIRKYKTILSIEKETIKRSIPSEPFFLQWTGESSIKLEAWQGILELNESDNGIDWNWLRQNVMRIDIYRGNAELKLPNRPTKKLKILCQEANIPLWERKFLPMIFVGQDLLYVGKLGQSAQFVKKQGKCVQFEWKPLPITIFK